MALREKHLHTYRELFCHRADLYAQQRPSGAYFLRHAPVTEEVIKSHLQGTITAGWYALRPDNTVRWVALDADQSDGLALLQHAWQALEGKGVPSHLELSRRGGHLWVLFEPLPAATARRLVLGSLPTLGAEVEVFPKRDKLDQGSKIGNLMRGPFGIHLLTGRRYPFVDPISLRPVSPTVVGTLEYLGGAARLSAADATSKLASLDREADYSPAALPGERRGVGSGRRSAMARVKELIGDPYAFIAQFVDLDERGRGHCPFHPPDHHPSFAVNREQGYWVDFHAVNPRTGKYVGGDVIEFYRRLKDLSYRQVLRELSGREGQAGS